jgi:hypothetical protein
MPNADRVETAYDLATAPLDSKVRSVTAVPADVAGRRALRVELTDAVTFQGQPGVDYVDMPTFVIIPAEFKDGTIEVEILSRLNDKGPQTATKRARTSALMSGSSSGSTLTALR